MNIKNCVQISSIELLKTTSTTLSGIGKQQSDTDGLVRSDTAFYCALYLSALFSSHHLLVSGDQQCGEADARHHQAA